MLEDLFGWRKASKCKVLIRRVRCRLKLLRNKRDVIVRQLKQDVVQLLKNGHHKSAFSRVEQLFKDQSILAAYDLLDHFCEFIIIQLPYIRKHRDCPNDINEAVSSLIFAAARCADLPELQILRSLFGERYGHEFAVAAVELFPESLVNRQISEKLSIRSVSDDVKIRLMEEIAREFSLPLRPSEVEDDCKEPHQKVYGNNAFKREKKVQKRDSRVISSHTKAAQTRGSNVDTTYDPLKNTGIYNNPEVKKTRFPGTLSKWKKLMENPCRTCASTNINSNSIIVVTAEPTGLNKPSINHSLPNGSTQEIDCPRSIPTAPMHSNLETISSESLSGKSTQLQEKNIVYLDDEADGFYLSLREESDLRIDISMPAKIGLGMMVSLEEGKQAKGNGKREGGSYLGTSRASLSDSHHDDCVINRINFNEWQERTGTKRSNKRKKLGRQSSDKQATLNILGVHCRESCTDYDEHCDLLDTTSTQSGKSHGRESCSLALMAVSMKDVEYALYYEEMGDNSGVDSPRHSWKAGGYIDKLKSSSQESHHHSVLDSEESLSITREVPSVNGKKLTRGNKHAINITEPELIRVSFPMEQWIDLNLKVSTDRKSGSRSSSNVATQIRRPNQCRESDINDDCRSSFPREIRSGSIQGSPMPPPYSRSVTMPPLERPKCAMIKQTHRSASFEQPCYSRGAAHIHPKLPDYDDLAAKFTALKDEHRRSIAR